MSTEPSSGSRPWNTLPQFANRPPPVERCELCRAIIPPQHPHLLELSHREVICSCQPCSILFSPQQHERYRLIPRDGELLTDFQMSDAQWSTLQIPIQVAFFTYVSSAEKVIALYPSPAGATESLLPLETWQDLVQVNPVLGQLQPDVEALLVNRLRTVRDHYRVGIDECYKLVGLLRANWRGLSGGTEAWEKVGAFFQSLKQRCSE